MVKNYKPVILVLLFALIGAVFVSGVFIIANKYLDSKDNRTVKCGTSQTTGHIVVIKDGKADPASTTAPLCDTLTILNKDSKLRFMTFGLHEEHQAYDGIEDKALKEGEGLTVTLNKAGSFRFHDHVDDLAQGTFTVTEPTK